MFVKELSLYINHLKEMIESAARSGDEKMQKQIQKFVKNILEGINYYKDLFAKKQSENNKLWVRVREGLSELEKGSWAEHVRPLETKLG